MEPNNPTQESIPNQSIRLLNPEKTVKQKRFFLPIIGVVFLLVVIGAGAYYLSTAKSSNKTVTESLTPTSSTQPTTTTQAQGGTTNWKTYTHPTFNFTMKYSPELKMLEGNPNSYDISFGTSDFNRDTSGTIVQGASLTLHLWPPTDEKFLDRYCESQKSRSASCKTTQVNGYKAVELIENNGVKIKLKEITIQIGSESTSLIAESAGGLDDKFIAIFDQVVSTFGPKN